MTTTTAETRPSANTSTPGIRRTRTLGTPGTSGTLGTLAFALLFSLTASAQAPPTLERQTPHTFRASASPADVPATLADFTWFQGEWTGTGLGGNCDESWSASAGGAMMGTFRFLKGNAPVFYEFLLLIEEKGTVVLKLKHFNPDLTGWEDKAKFVTFRLLKISKDEAIFGGLTFQRVGDDGMRIYLALRDGKDGPPREEEFVYKRVGTRVRSAGL